VTGDGILVQAKVTRHPTTPSQEGHRTTLDQVRRQQ